MDLILANVSSVAEAHERVINSARRLKDSGSLVLIANWSLAYELKLAADEAFRAERSLRNEIIWVVREAGRRRERHATVLWYVKNPRTAPFVELPMPRSRETIRRFGDGRIHSAVNPQTKRRSPARIEGASTSTALNDVWVWDDASCVWISDLDEINDVSGDVFPRVVPLIRSVASAEHALTERLMGCTGYAGNAGVEVAHETWAAESD